MFGRKHTTAALVATLGLVAFIGGCRGEASTGSSNIPSSEFAAGLRLQTGDVQSGPLAQALPQALTVRVVDAGGEPVQGASVTWSVLSGGGTVNPPTGVSNAQGLVSTTWTLGPALGANSVRAYLTRGYNLDSATFTATATVGAPVVVTLDSTALPPATTMVGSAVTVRFKVKDQFGNLIPGATVNFTVPAGSGTLASASAVTSETGIASVVWTTGTQVGVRSMSASLAGGVPVTVSLTTTPGTGRVLTQVSANPPAATAGSSVAPIAVRVTDQFGNVIAGEVVTFNSVLPPGVTVTPTTMATNATGDAMATYRLGNALGTDTVRATIAGGGSVPFAITSTMTFRDVYAGNYFACGIGTNDRAYCWGFGQDGQLGNAGLTSTAGPRFPVTSADPVAGPYPTFRELAGGRSHTCGVALSRSIYCWGFDVEGRLFPTAASIPVRISTAVESPSAFVANARTVVAGEAHSCMLTLGGLAICSGNNELGQLGATAGASLGALSVGVDTSVGPPIRPTRYSAISAGERHTCGMPRFVPSDTLALQHASRTPWCWGQNNNGQLGLGPTIFADSVRPTQIQMPVGVAAFDSTSLVTGAAHTCALADATVADDLLTANRVPYCWGSNGFGQLGNGSVAASGSRSPVPVAVDISTSGGFVRLYAGEHHTCGITSTGSAWCWGRNDRGQLNGTASASVTAPTLAPGGPYRGLALGELFTCGIAGQLGSPGTTSPTGTIFCWGDNEYGQVGSGSFSANGLVLGLTRVAGQQ